MLDSVDRQYPLRETRRTTQANYSYVTRLRLKHDSRTFKIRGLYLNKLYAVKL